MSIGPERKFRNKLRPLLEEIPNSFWESIQQVTIKGSPDIVGCVRGTFVGLELKSKNGKVSALQRLKLDKIMKAGGLGLVVSPDNYKQILEGLIALGSESGHTC